MIKLQRINTSHGHYPFVEALMQTAFPSQERRNADLQRVYTDNKSNFHTHVILNNYNPVGLLTYWKFEGFILIEHFAIHEKERNKGIGREVITYLKQTEQKMIILEAEEPVDEISKRRIDFYQRQGFILQDIPYKQPPYRENDEWFPMKLMTLHETKYLSSLERAIKTIYKEVYNVTQPS